MTEANVDSTDETFEKIVEGELTYHSVLEVWQALLTDAVSKRDERISSAWALRVCGNYQEMTIAQMPVFRELFFDLVAKARDELSTVIETDMESLKVTNALEDLEHNTAIYMSVISAWQIMILKQELTWDCASFTAVPQLAALGEISRMLFSERGMVTLLEGIGFHFTESDQEKLAETMREYQTSQEG